MKRLFILVLILIVGGLLLRSAGVFDNPETTPQETQNEQTNEKTEQNNEENAEEIKNEEPSAEGNTEETNETSSQDIIENMQNNEEQTEKTETTTQEKTEEQETETVPEIENKEETQTEEPQPEEDITHKKTEASSIQMEAMDYDQTVKVYLYEWEIDILNGVIKPGNVQFEVLNTGRRSHRFGILGGEDFGKVKPGERRIFGTQLPEGEFSLYSSISIDQERGMMENIMVTW